MLRYRKMHVGELRKGKIVKGDEGKWREMERGMREAISVGTTGGCNAMRSRSLGCCRAW